MVVLVTRIRQKNTLLVVKIGGLSRFDYVSRFDYKGPDSGELHEVVGNRSPNLTGENLCH